MTFEFLTNAFARNSSRVVELVGNNILISLITLICERDTEEHTISKNRKRKRYHI